MNRRLFLAASAAAALLPVAGAIRSAHAQKAPVYTGIIDGVGAGGYDVVAYFTEGQPRKGNADITADHKGVTYRFSSAENRDAFAADPERYAPRYGGYCAWAVAEGYTASADPEAWSVVDGRLYLNYSKDIRARWERDIPGNIARAEANWPVVLHR